MHDRSTTSLWLLLLGGTAAAAYAAYLKRRRSRSKPASPVASFEDDNTFAVAVVDFQEDRAARKFTDSLKQTGFAVLTNHPVPSELITGVYDEWRSFMVRLHEDASLQEKYYHDLATQDGYFPMAVSEKAKGAKVKDLKHYYQLYFPHGQYPDADVSDDARKLWGELTTLGKTLVGWIDDHMPPEIKARIQQKIGQGRTLSECVSDERTMLRVLHYPGYADSEVEEGAVRAAAHEDINLITVLPAGSARGLQVKSNQSGEWHEVPLVEGSIVINIGDMMQSMSDGAYVSTTHRVVKMAAKPATAEREGMLSRAASRLFSAMGSGDAEHSNAIMTQHAFATADRMSTPCFIHLKAKCPVSSIHGSAEHFLTERLVTLGVKPQEALDDFLTANPGGRMAGWNPAEE
jgi:isopenicillin N synthase-like dioxygenase